MSQCLLNATIQSHQHRCSCTHSERCASSLRHTKSHAFTSSPVASSFSSFAGTPLRASLLQKVAKQQQPNAGAIRCQATADKMVIAVTGRSRLRCIDAKHARSPGSNSLRSKCRSDRPRWQQAGITAFSSRPYSQSFDKEPRQGTWQASVHTNQVLQHTAAASRGP